MPRFFKRAIPLSIKRPLALGLMQTPVYRRYERAFADYDYRSIEFFIHQYSRSHENIFFIQVGANDGKTWDPYHFFVERDSWRGIVIEPQKKVFEERLQSTYASNKNITLINAAVDEQDGSRELYKFSFSSSRWATGLASFDRERVLAAFDMPYVQDSIRAEGLEVPRDRSAYVISETVRCVSFRTLLQEGNVERIDFLATDVEGFDIQILDTFPLDRLRPRNIVFELTNTRDDRFLNFTNKLRDHDYDIFLIRNDAIAVARGDT